VIRAAATLSGRWFHTVEDGRLQCDLCPRHCRLRDGQHAFCAVRQRIGDRIVCTTYGRTTGLAVDPIEKKPLFHYLPATTTLSFGTQGCNLGCRFCQNWHMSKASDPSLLRAEAAPADIVRIAQARGCASVAFTYNDPIVWAEYAIDTATACREAGLGTVAVTAGFISRGARAEFFGAMDAANVDLKGFSAAFYHDVCLSGHDTLANVLETLTWLRHESQVWFEITTLLIPGYNDSTAELEAECRWIATELGTDVPLHFTAFHPDFTMRDVPPTPMATLTRARTIAADAGLEYVYAGNVRDPAAQTTWCRGCGAALIERDGYWVPAIRIDAHGRCRRCWEPLPGRFGSAAG
jgi:pyruvate formate lyase activating enzyme